MKILVIGAYSNLPPANLPTPLNLALGLERMGVDFDYFPDILGYDYSNLNGFKPFFESSGIKCPGYDEVFSNIKRGAYNFVISATCGSRYKNRTLALIRWLKYPLPKTAMRMGGHIVLEWIRSGIELPPFVVIDDGDKMILNPVDFKLLTRCALYFKRELPFNRYLCFELVKHRLNADVKMNLASKLRPMWLSFDADVLRAFIGGSSRSYSERSIDMHYLCDPKTNNVRHKITAALEAFKEKKVLDYRRGRMDRWEYFKTLSDSKICISMPGGGWDCFRHYEAMMSGALLLVTRPYIEVAIKFKYGHNCVFVENDIEDFSQKLGYYLDNADVSARIASNGYLYAKEQLDNRKLAEYVVNETIGVL